MLYDKMFAQTNVLRKAMDASLLKQETISNNIANADTPGYKKQTVQFETYLSNALDEKSSRASSIDLNSINPKVVLESPQYDMRIDGSNIDIDVEMSERSKNAVKYSTFVEFLNTNSQRMSAALNGIK